MRELESFPHPWFVSGGWAIDLFVGEVTREHEDLEVTVFRHHQHAIREHFPGRRLFKARDGWVPWQEDEQLELPVHQVLVLPPGMDTPAEDWDPRPGELQLFLNEVEDGIWRSRRDPEKITRPAGQVYFESAAGIPIVAPEIQLLYKAKWHRDKDDQDSTGQRACSAPRSGRGSNRRWRSSIPAIPGSQSCKPDRLH